MQRLPLAEGTPEGLEVWHLALDLTAPIADDDDRLLSRAEWQRAQRFRHRADAVRAMATRAALRRLLSAHTGIAPEKLVFTQNAYGKPELENAEGPAFNVSHSGRVALIALAPGGAVGVDIERCDPRWNWRRCTGWCSRRASGATTLAAPRCPLWSAGWLKKRCSKPWAWALQSICRRSRLCPLLGHQAPITLSTRSPFHPLCKHGRWLRQAATPLP